MNNVVNPKAKVTYEFLLFALVSDVDNRFAALLLDLERPVLDVTLNFWVFHFTTN